MLLIVNGYEGEEQSELSDAMFELRQKVFFDQKGPNVRVGSSFGNDEFEHDGAIYSCALGNRGALLETVRLLHTITGHMAMNIFGSLVKSINICFPAVWDTGRFAVAGDPNIPPNGVSRAARELRLGVFTFGREYGVSQFTAIYEAPLGAFSRQSGIQLSGLGSARMDPHSKLFFRSLISQVSLKFL